MSKYIFLGDENQQGQFRISKKKEDPKFLKVGEAIDLSEAQLQAMAPDTRKQFYSAEKEAEEAAQRAAEAEARIAAVKKEAAEAAERAVAKAEAEAKKRQVEAAEKAQAAGLPEPPKPKRGRPPKKG